MSPSLRDRVQQAALATPVEKRPHSSRLRVAARVALCAGLMAVPLWIAGGPSHAEGRPAAIGAAIVAGLLLVAVASTVVALPPRRSMLPRARGYLLAAVALVPVAIGASISLWHAAYLDPFVRIGVRCFAFTAVTAPWPFLALLSLGPRLDPVQPGLSGAALGAAAGAWAAIMVELWCPLADGAHVAIGHVAPVVLVVAAGAYAGTRLLRPRFFATGER